MGDTGKGRRLQAQGIATAEAVSKLIDSFADNYTHAANALKTTVTSVPVMRIIKEGFSAFKINGSYTQHCIPKANYNKFVNSPRGALRHVHDKGLDKKYEDNLKEWLANEFGEKEFKENETSVNFNQSGNSDAKAYTLTYSEKTQRAIEDKCVEYISSLTVLGGFKLADNIVYIDRQVSAAGGIADVKWFGQQKEPRDMSLEEIGVLSGYLKAWNLDNFAELVGIPKTASLK